MFFRERLKAKTTPLEQPQTVTLTTSAAPPQRAAVPEPSTLVALSLGLLTFVGLARRRTRTA